tara:strand:+ start:2883 stop:3683 length:801 start_codon:yes stop_codon:yes gene_type:complete
MNNNLDICVITDVDGTLMDHTYDLSPIENTVKWLNSLSIPLVLCTSKTASEVKVIREELKLNTPYIVENGAVIYGEEEDTNLEWEIVLGESYLTLKEILHRLSKDLNYELIELNSLSDHEISNLTNLQGDSINLLRDRHWSVPFLNPPEEIRSRLEILSKDYNVNIFQGNRMSHLLGDGSHKGKALLALKKIFKKDKLITIGLGDSPNDAPFLEMVDYPIVIPGSKGPNMKLINKLKVNNYIVSPKRNGYGWSLSVKELISKILES